MFDPLHHWIGIPPQEQPPTHYRLLGVAPFETDVQAIDAAYEQRMTYLHGCSNGEHAELAEKWMNCVSAARLTLIHPEKRASYDATLRRSIAQPATASIPTPPASPAPATAAVRPILAPPPRPIRPNLPPPIRSPQPANPFNALSPRAATDGRNFVVHTSANDGRSGGLLSRKPSLRNWILAGFSLLVSGLLLGIGALVLALMNPGVPPPTPPSGRPTADSALSPTPPSADGAVSNHGASN
ncbi:hypothetical protein Poly24_45280 [Rosistilla carotiformis]|uniref:J domain-containing protein n=1 Tax=Rosistilla carotiformis TaxID=2528017 RepID=A0A518JZ26_9BACT|nr:J domain-containing protein [Rosistilla carotiformis]QDV70796.1 hypothetical protein Poly24_45280 [Rosistilla carotiformis]